MPRLDINIILENEITLDNNVIISPFIQLHNITLGTGTQIRAHSDLENIITKNAVQIDPFARLRPGTMLADGVHIDNFMKTKKITMGIDNKTNHLTYLNNTVISNKINIDAGTITCNYNKMNKSQTTISDSAFINSNNTLITPIEINTNSTIGTKSIITRNTPTDQLTITRAQQTMIKG